MTSQNSPALNQWQIWILAIRPKTLPAAAAGVVAGCALAWREGFFAPLPALAALLAAILLQIGSNLANDVYDFERGADAERKHGPLRVTQSGLLSPKQVKRGMGAVFALAAALGLYLISVGGWPILAIGLGAIFSAIAYTGGPFPLGYYGLGEVFVFLFFGGAAVAGTYYLQAGQVSALAWWLSLPIGWLVSNILVVNNLRDIETDRVAGKHTLAVRLGAKGARWQFGLGILGAYAVLFGLIFIGSLPWSVLLVFVSLPLAWRVTRIVFRQSGPQLNQALAGSGQLALLYALLFWVGLILGG